MTLSATVSWVWWQTVGGAAALLDSRSALIPITHSLVCHNIKTADSGSSNSSGPWIHTDAILTLLELWCRPGIGLMAAASSCMAVQPVILQQVIKPAYEAGPL